MMIAFLVWTLLGCGFVGLGIYCLISSRKTAVGFWANAEMFSVENTRAYNRAVGKLWLIFGIVFIILGLPLLSRQNSAVVLISILGTLIEAIAAMIVYVMIIEKKYRKR